MRWQDTAVTLVAGCAWAAPIRYVRMGIVPTRPIDQWRRTRTEDSQAFGGLITNIIAYTGFVCAPALRLPALRGPSMPEATEETMRRPRQPGTGWVQRAVLLREHVGQHLETADV